MGFFNKKEKPFIIPAKFYRDEYYQKLFEENKEEWVREVNECRQACSSARLEH